MVTGASQHTCSSVQERDNPKNILGQLSAGIQCLHFELKFDCNAEKEELKEVHWSELHNRGRMG